MKVLVAFGTTEGQTKKIADHVVKRICDLGHEAQSYDCAARLSGMDVGSFDAYIVAASVHQKLHQEQVMAFVLSHRELLNAKPSAFISVSLAAGYEDGKADAHDYVKNFIRDTAWWPAQTHMAAGALHFMEYDFFKEQILRHIVLKDRDLPGAGGKHDSELTDWAALDDFISAFIESLVSQS